MSLISEKPAPSVNSDIEPIISLLYQKKTYKKAKKAKKSKKAVKLAYDCIHTDRKMYAKGKCNYCYHKFSRNKPATDCPHPERNAYCRNKCMACYQQWKNQRNA